MNYFSTLDTMLWITILASGLICGLIQAVPLINVYKFTERLQGLARDAVGKDFVQELVDTRAKFTAESIDHEDLAELLSDRLSLRFAEYFVALERIRTAAEEAYAGDKFQQSSQYDSTFPQCCHLTEQQLEYDARFFTEADPRSVCYRVSADAQDTYTVPATDDMLHVMKQNFLDTPTLKWQYFGTEDGIQLKFPAHVSDNCGNYDPRFRPWYVESSSPVPKDLVLVIDSSGSMETSNRMDIAKDAAQTVVETLNPNDRIGLVRFSSSASTPPGSNVQSLCYNTDMAYAIPDNVRYLKSYIQDIQAFGQTAYLAALDTAFELLKQAEEVPDQKRDKVILFLTDGEPTDSEQDGILDKIRDLNSEMNNAVTIMTYGLSISNGTEELLLAMARQEKSDKRSGDINVGVFTKIDSEDNLRFDLGSYYSHFSSKAALEKPIISVPYIGFSGLGLISSICDTVLYDAHLKGVACVDVRIADILGDIEFAQPGEYSYTFIIDQTGRTLVHPLMPSPFQVADDPKFIDITVLEREKEAQDVIESMKSGGSGSKTFDANFTIGAGHSKTYGVEVTRMRAVYQWRQIARSGLSFCMVFALSDQKIDISVQGNTQHFLYHRFDIMEPPNMCNNGGRLSKIDQSSIAFSDEAFADVLMKDSGSLTAEDITKMKNYMMSTGYKWDALKDGVKDTIVLTEQMDNFWKSKNEKYAPYVSARYVGSDNGMFRVYPAISLPVNYSHTGRAWYSEAVANRDKLVMSVPYVDAFRAGVVTSIMHSILEGKQSHSAEDTVIGAIGADVDTAYIRYLVMDTYPQCAGDKYICFLMDESGYMVFHPSLADVSSVNGNIHIIKHEPEIAEILIDAKYMSREECVSLAENKAWLTWKVQTKRPIERKDGFMKFELHWVTGSNVFVGIKDKTSQRGTSACHCPDAGSGEFRCQRTDSLYCECPCYAVADYDYCSNSFHKESLPVKTCTPPKESSLYESPVKDEVQRAAALPPCFHVTCAGISNKWECNALSSCNWCPTSVGGTPGCSISTKCVAPADPASLSEPGTSKGAIVGGVVGGLVLIAIIAGVVAFVVWKKHNEKPSGMYKAPMPPSSVIYRPPPTPPPLRDSGYLQFRAADNPHYNPHESIYHEIPASIPDALPRAEAERENSMVRPVSNETYLPMYNQHEPVGYEVPQRTYDTPPPGARQPVNGEGFDSRVSQVSRL